MAKPTPDGFRSVTPHLSLTKTGEAIEFYKQAFNAEETCRMPGPGGAIMYAEVRIGDSIVMLSEAMGDMGKSPTDLGGCHATVHLYVEDVDKAFEQAASAGAKVVMPVADQFWGDRYGIVEDPFGQRWSIATHKEDLTPEQIGERMAAAFGNNPDHCQ